ncbi:MAG: hypothetical protein PHF21_04450 [Bacilli bacterium]|nr:hypothetical protein [Bacilli bacterium]
MFITFDPYYSVKDYSDFIENSKKLGYKLEEYISLKTPYNWYIKVNKDQLPIFLKYDIASDSTQRFLVEKIKPLYPNEEYMLTRRSTDAKSEFERFVSPKIFQKIKSASYCCLFRYKNKDDLIKITKKLPTIIYDLGNYKTWNLALCFNKYIRNYIFSSWVLLEKKNESDFSKPGEFEYLLNYKILVDTKFNNKTIEYSYFKDGTYTPLKRIK